jgi:hypothetical protein
VGYGDEIISTGQARGAKARGKRIAFGNGTKIIWHHFSNQIFQGNPNIAWPGSEKDPDIEWIANYVGCRPYNRDNKLARRWDYIPGQIKGPGEVFLTPAEIAYAEKHSGLRNYVLIEPNVPAFKSSAANKQWPVKRYQAVVKELRFKGYEVVQLRYNPPWGPGIKLEGVRLIGCPDFRHALAFLQRAALYLGPEGGMHHGAAAVGTDATVIFGGYISPDITGYTWHENHYHGGVPCGNYDPCDHCLSAMAHIETEDVFRSCLKLLEDKNGRT